MAPCKVSRQFKEALPQLCLPDNAVEGLTSAVRINYCRVEASFPRCHRLIPRHLVLSAGVPKSILAERSSPTLKSGMSRGIAAHATSNCIENEIGHALRHHGRLLPVTSKDGLTSTISTTTTLSFLSGDAPSAGRT